MRVITGGATQKEGDAPNQENAADSTTSEANHKTKSGRQRYLRLFPERATYLLSTLTPAELAAYLALLVRYVVNDGRLEDGDHLAHVAGVSVKRWRDLRSKLLALGLFEDRAGWLIDADQDKMLEYHRKSSTHGYRAATARWGRRHG